MCPPGIQKFFDFIWFYYACSQEEFLKLCDLGPQVIYHMYSQYSHICNAELNT